MRSFADSAVFCKSAAPMSRWQRLAVARVLRAASTAAPRQIERRSLQHWVRGTAVLASEGRVRHPRGSRASAAGPSNAPRPRGQQTAKPPWPRKSRNVSLIPGPTLHFCEVIRAGAGGSFLTEFQPLLGPPALPAARHSTLLASLHLTRETMSLRASCAANGTAIRQNAERHNGVRQAMGLEDAEASVSHEFDSCKRAGSLTSLPWRSRAGTFATVTSGVEKL